MSVVDPAGAPLQDKRATPRLERGGALDALRFLAAAFIVLFHYGDEAPIPLARLWSVFDRGYLATDFFLMLSGYVLGRVYGPRLDAARLSAATFLGRRIQRVWPLHLAALAALAALVWLSGVLHHPLHHPEAYVWGKLPAQALLVQAWGPWSGGALGWNQPSWTLSALVVCYAVFPALWRAARRFSATAWLAICGAVLVGATVISRTRGLSFFDLPFALGALRALPLFALGAALARFGAAPPPTPRTRLALGVAAIAGLAALQALPRSDLTDLAAMSCIALGIFSAGARPPVHASALARGAADLSFALFLSHHLAGALWFGVSRALQGVGGGSAAWGWLLWLGSLAFALLLAQVFTVLDRGLQAWLAAVEARLRRARTPAIAAGG